MVPFAGYSMPVQYPAGLMAEHLHTRQAAGLFDVSHMGQLRLVGPDAAAAFETLIPVDVIGLGLHKQRYGLLLNDEGGIIDDLMFVNRGDDLFVIVNGACKAGDIAHIQEHIGGRCEVIPLPDQALLALQGPQAATALARLAPGTASLVFMTGGRFEIAGCDCYVTRSGYTGEDGFEISVPAAQAEALARAAGTARGEAHRPRRAQLAAAGSRPVPLRQRHRHHHHAPEAALNWAIQKVRRTGGARAGGFPGADKVLAQIDDPSLLTRRRVGLVARERVPVREHTALQSTDGTAIGEVTSGLLGPSVNQPIAMGYVAPEFAAPGTVVHAIVRGKAVPMEVSPMPFLPARYHRG